MWIQKKKWIYCKILIYLRLLTKNIAGKVTKFIQTMRYSGMEDESVTETKLSIYKQLKRKTSQRIPRNENSMLQAIKPIHYQLFQKLICQRMVRWSLKEMFSQFGLQVRDRPLISFLILSKFEWLIIKIHRFSEFTGE